MIGTIFLVWCAQAHNGWATAGVILYLFGMLCSYTASTVYHALSAKSVWKERLRRWDHAAIYWHIAGSYSPITLVALRDEGYWGWGLFVFVWLCAITGTVMAFRKLKAHSNLETLCFVLMGLSVLAAFKPLMDAVSSSAGSGMAYRRGSGLYHRRAFLYATQAAVQPYHLPLLRAPRFGVPYHLCLGCADAVYLTL